MLLLPAAGLAGAAGWFLILPNLQKQTVRPAARMEVPKVTTGPDAGYIGSGSCAECHKSISESFSKIAMGRSLYLPTETNIIEDYTSASEYYHEPSQQYFRMSHEGGRFYQARYQKGPDGKPFNELKAEITYIIGSGNHARSYLHQEPDGKVYQLPVAWYPPGEEVGDESGL